MNYYSDGHDDHEPEAWRFGWVGVLAVLVAWLFMVACMLATSHPAFELFTHTSLHVFFGCVGLMILLLVRLGFQVKVIGTRRLRAIQIACLLVPTIYFGIKTEPWFIFRRSPPSVVDSPTIKVFSWNLWLENFRAKEIESIAKSCDADIIVLIESNFSIAELLEEFRDSGEYPTNHWDPAWSSGGMVILSKFPDTEFTPIDLKAAGTYGVEVFVPSSADRPEFHLMAVHTRSPTSFRRTIQRDKQFDVMAEWARWQKSPAMIIGDLNVTPWSPAYQKLIVEGELHDSRHGFGYCASWPSVLGDFGIPIDHALTNRNCRAVARTVLSTAPGSDHRPISVTVELTSPRGAMTNRKREESGSDDLPNDESEAPDSTPSNPFRTTSVHALTPRDHFRRLSR